MESVQRLSNWLMVSFALFALFNILDLSTTILALKMGLTEGNSALIFFASRLDFSLVNFLVIIKCVFILGAGFLVLIAVGTRNLRIEKMVFVWILAFTLIYAIVAGSNFLSLLVS